MDINTNEKNIIGFQYSAEELKICELAGIKVKDFYSDIKLMVDTQKRTSRIISRKLEIPEPEPLLCYGHVKGAEVMGCEIQYHENNEPAVRGTILNDILDVNKFKPKHPEENNAVQDLIKKAKQFYEFTGIKNTITFEGPFTVSGFIVGQINFLLAIKDNQVLCEKLIEKVTDAAIEWKKYHDFEIGIKDSETTGLIDDSIINIDPVLFEKIVSPHLIRYYEAFPSQKRAFHCCGNINNFLSSLSKLNLAFYDLMGEVVDIKKARLYFKDTYISQLVDFRILRDGTEGKIRNYIESILAKVSEDSNYCISVEGQIGVPLSKVRIVRDTVIQQNEGRMISIKKSAGI